jgi:hypothetical protein
MTFEAERVMTLIDRASHDLSQDVIATLVTGQNSVGNRKRGGARVVRNHAHRESFLRFRFVISIGELCGEVDDRRIRSVS